MYNGPQTIPVGTPKDITNRSTDSNSLRTMGNCMTMSTMEASSLEIDAAQRQRAEEMRREVKLLLLGAGESGKSTLFKQMKIIHKDGYTPEECMVYRDIIRSNVLQSMKSLVAASRTLSISIAQKQCAKYADEVMQFDQQALLDISTLYTPELGLKLQELWQDEGIQKVYEQRSQFQLLDSTEYFFIHMDRINHCDYVPTQQDVLRCRVKTTGIVESDFDLNGFKFRFFDVGGQRNERKKWIHCFENVTTLLYVTSLSEYDQKCYEDDSTLRVQESLILFDEICNSRYFQHTPIILLFNKKDIFAEKIKRVDLRVTFGEYTGGDDFEMAADFIRSKFLALIRDEEKTIYTHFTCATDTGNIKNVFDNVKDIILMNNAPGIN